MFAKVESGIPSMTAVEYVNFDCVGLVRCVGSKQG